MASRRRFLHLAGGTLAATAGCIDRSDPASTATDSDAPDRSTPTPVDDGPRTTPVDVPEWTPEWMMPFDDWHVLGLDTAGGLLFTTLSKDNGPSAVAAVDPTDQSIPWQTESEGEAVSLSYSGSHSRGQWGVTLAGDAAGANSGEPSVADAPEDAVYAVAGPAEEREWSAAHALDRATGERRWSFERERELVVAGITGSLVVVTATEFFPSSDETPVSHQTPESPLSTVVYGLDAADGAVRWEHEFFGVVGVAVNAHGVSVGAEDGLVGLDRTGENAFTYDRGPATQVAAATDRVFYLTGEDDDATLHGVAPNGDAEWRRALPVDELLLDGDRCYAGGDAVVAVEADGTVAWRDDAHGGRLMLDPDRDALYTRSGVQADAATAYDAAGAERWTFDPPSTNAWPEAATSDALVATAITGDHADEPFYTVYAVNGDGKSTASMGRDTVFEALGMGGTVYLADGDSGLIALEP